MSHLINPLPQGFITTQKHLAPEQVLVFSLSLTETLDSAPKMLYFSEKAPQSLWQESVGTPTFILLFVLSDISLCPFV